MTRILYWNIERFSINKFWQPNRKRNRAGMIVGGPYTNRANDRFDYFLSALDNNLPLGTTANAARTPDIIVIVELVSGLTGRGHLVTANGPQATQNLVTGIRAGTGNTNWVVVPPLYTGPREGIIVLYDSTNLIFTGPNIWPGGGGPATPPPFAPHPLPGQPPGPPSPYPTGWHPFIRTGGNNRSIPAGSLYNQNLWENQMAARVAGFTSSGGAGLTPAPGGMPVAGAPMDGNLGPRTPYMVTFYRPAAGPAPAENITLFAIHAPANNHAARNYMTAMASTQEIAAAPGGNERKVVIGDLNFNLFTNANLVPQNYQYFQQLGYGIGIAPVPLVGFVPPAGPPLGYFEYFATHLTRTNQARNWSNNNANRYYPGYGYFSDRYKCIDNIFVNGGTLANTTVLNPIVGSPYNVLPPGGHPPPVWLTPAMQGHFDIASLCDAYNLPNPTPQWQAPPYGVTPQLRQVFRAWVNFGRIRSTSDHLPIIADI